MTGFLKARGNLRGNGSIAAADFSNGWVRAIGGFFEEEMNGGGVAHQRVDAAEVAAGLDGARIGGGEFVEQLWFDDAVHPSRKAP